MMQAPLMIPDGSEQAHAYGFFLHIPWAADIHVVCVSVSQESGGLLSGVNNERPPGRRRRRRMLKPSPLWLAERRGEVSRWPRDG